MNIQGINGTTTPARIASSTAEGTAASARASAATKTPDAPTAEQTADNLESQPSTPRFPWLSRLTTQLSAASQTPVTFAAPIIGDNLDKRA